MKVLFVSLLLVAGAFARSAVHQSTHAEGPRCPIDDPLFSPGPDTVNVTLDPLFKIDVGSTRGDINAVGLSTLWFNVSIEGVLLRIEFELTLTAAEADSTFVATGYIDGRPFRQETIPSGNFTGEGTIRLGGGGAHIKGSGSLWINVIGNRVTLQTLTVATVTFTDLHLHLTGFTVGGQEIDWDAWSDSIKDNFDADWAQHQTAMTDKVRLAANNILGQYTLAELIDLIGDGSEPEPCPTDAPRLH